MNAIAKLVSAVGLALTVVPSLLVFAGTLDWRAHAWWMLVGTVLWFLSAPVWMRDRTEEPL